MAFNVRAHRILGDEVNNGAFSLFSCEPGWQLFLIASDGAGWEHVSVHARRSGAAAQQRTPTWREMCLVKDACWDDPEDVVVQFHPRRSEYVNQHPHVLHLWRPVSVALPTPDPILVGRRDQDGRGTRIVDELAWGQR